MLVWDVQMAETLELSGRAPHSSRLRTTSTARSRRSGISGGYGRTFPTFCGGCRRRFGQVALPHNRGAIDRRVVSERVKCIAHYRCFPSKGSHHATDHLGSDASTGSPRGDCTNLSARPTFIESTSAVILREQSFGQSTIVAGCDGPTEPGKLRHPGRAEGMPANATPPVSLLPRESSVTPRGAKDHPPPYGPVCAGTWRKRDRVPPTSSLGGCDIRRPAHYGSGDLRASCEHLGTPA
jgi:hypothetical protein